jgi:hypothetical protein
MIILPGSGRAFGLLPRAGKPKFYGDHGNNPQENPRLHLLWDYTCSNNALVYDWRSG